jgi:hypothetical protein
LLLEHTFIGAVYRHGDFTAPRRFQTGVLAFLSSPVRNTI